MEHRTKQIKPDANCHLHLGPRVFSMLPSRVQRGDWDIFVATVDTDSKKTVCRDR